MSVALADASGAYPPAHLSAPACVLVCPPTTCMCQPPSPAAQPPTVRVWKHHLSGGQGLSLLEPAGHRAHPSLTAQLGRQVGSSRVSGMRWPALALPQACPGGWREGFEGVAGPPVPQSWSRPRPPPPPRRPPSVSGTPHAPAGPVPPGLFSLPPPVDTEWARVRYLGTAAHPTPVLLLAAPTGHQSCSSALS